MNLAARMSEARRRQSVRGRLRWLLDDFCRRDLTAPQRPGELLDLGDDVRAFADADDAAEPTQDDLRQIQAATLAGLKALFSESGARPWSLGRVPVVLHTTRDPKELARVKPRRAAVDHAEGMVTRLAVPLRLHVPKGKEPLAARFETAAALEVMHGWDAAGRCPRCWGFFYAVRRQVFCSPQCKQEAMDARKATRAKARARRKQ